MFATMLHKFSSFKSMNIFEKFGFSLSFLCAIHCVLTPIFIALLPLVSTSVLTNPAIEMVLVGTSFLIVGVTNLIGFLKHHRKYSPLIVTLLGFSVLVTGQVLHHVNHIHKAETILSVLGGILIGYSILLNTKAKEVVSECKNCSH